jgi:diaminopimelate epimerase
MKIKFTKMHGLGNDFMVIDAVHQSFTPDKDIIRTLADRHRGVGFDQCLLVEKSADDDADFYYRIFNADGNEVGQCGNGARCLARFLRYHGLTDKSRIRVATSTARMELKLNEDNSVSVNMGKPRFKPQEIPLTAEQQKNTYDITANGERVEFHAVNVGNPHIVITVDDLANAPVQSLGAELSEHDLFPEQTNVGFMQIISADHIALRVYERGCGETSACGSGAVAAAVVGRAFHQLSDTVTISLTGGELTVKWPDLSSDVFLTGPAAFVYEGKLIP